VAAAGAAAHGGVALALWRESAHYRSWHIRRGYEAYSGEEASSD